MEVLFKNSIITPDGTILVSSHVHDYVCHIDKNGHKYCVDGGNEYRRRVCSNLPDYKENSITSESDIEQIREVFKWGTYGKSGDESKTYKLLKELSDDHVKAIIKTQTHLSDIVQQFFKKELSFRKRNKITIKD